MANWKNLFTNTPIHFLDFFPPDVRDGISIVSPPKEVYTEGAAEWKHTLVAQFLGKPPNFSMMQRILSKLWEKKGSLNISIACPNLFMFQFDNDIICNWILENDPWHVQHNTMILHKWQPNLGAINFDLEMLLIWFHLHKILLELYNRKGISHILSAIGTPLYMDSGTASRKRLAYAKVCIEVKASIDPPESVTVELEDGSLTSIPVTIPWKPLVCKTCSLFGHSDEQCKKLKVAKTIQVWKPKENTEVNNEPPQEEVVVVDPITTILSCTIILKEDTSKFDVKKQNSGKLKGKLVDSGNSSSSNKQKFLITSSTNKYATLCDDAPSDAETNVDDLSNLPDVEAGFTVWEQIVNNVIFNQRKPRVAAQGAVKVLMVDMKSRKNRLIAEGSKKGGVSTPPLRKRK